MNSAEITLQYYNDHAEQFIARTSECSLNELHRRFLDRLEPGDRILDFGCGSARDARAFLKAGYAVEALDGSKAMADHAKAAGVECRCMDFRQFSDKDAYNGIWACASLLHLEKEDLFRVLESLCRALKKNGILYCSMKKGNFKGMRSGRYFQDQTMDSLKALLEQTGFHILDLFETADVRKEQEGQIWINAIARKK